MNGTVLRAIIIIQSLGYAGTLFVRILKRKTLSNILWTITALLSLSLVVNNFVVNGYVPFVSMYQLLTFQTVMFSLLYLYIRFARDGEWSAPYFIACSEILSIGLCFMDANASWQFPPALRSVWFVPHIFMYVISYVMAAIAFAMVVTKPIKLGISARTKSSENRDGDSDWISRINRGIFDCVRVIFPFMTAGMFFGAIWANEVWGAFWNWDIKECWSLVTWLVYACYIHVGKSEKLKKLSDPLCIIGFACVIITFFFVRFMTASSDSVHTYNS